MALPQKEPSPGLPEWLLTFGDMMSLLLTFFIMLYSVSEIRQEKKFQAMLASIHKSFGYRLALTESDANASPLKDSELAQLAALGRARRASIMKGGALAKAAGDAPDQGSASRPDGDPTMAGVVSFQEDSDSLSEAAQDTLRNLAHEIAGIPQRIEIRGHTSNRPLPTGSPFRDHWDLAYARCRKVEAFLVQLGIDPRRIRLGVAAGYELKYTGTDRLRQGENPRVEVLVLPETIEAPLAVTPDTS